MSPDLQIPQPESLVEALEHAARERAREEKEIELALAEVAKEEVVNRKAIDESYRRITALRLLRREFEERRAALATSSPRYEWAAVRNGLLADRFRFMRRVEELRVAAKARDEQLAEEMRAPEIAAALMEFERFQTEVEPTLGALPASYRRAILETHERNLRRLDPYIRALNSLTPKLDAPVQAVGVVACASPADGRPEALVLVLPVPFEVYREWATRDEDLAGIFAYRLVAAVFKLLTQLGAEDAPVEYFEVHECLALQVWLGDHTVQGDLREQTLEHIGAAYESGPELTNAAVEVYGVWLRPELLTEDGYG